MKRLLLFCVALFGASTLVAQELFPDGTPIDKWFFDKTPVKQRTLGDRYVVTDHGVVRDSLKMQTKALQWVIDEAAAYGGGVVVIPEGVYLTGALFFPQGVHLHLEEGAVLKGSDDIADFPILDTRIEGQNRLYFAALINADRVDGFTITGKGAIDGNGLRYWRSFWLRRKWNPKCTNVDEMRPRLVYISNAKNVRIEDVTLRNSPFWTCHLYRAERVKIDGVHFFAPAKPVKAPSSDALDLDICRDVVVRNCYLSVNDDAIALKGGKGPWADKDPNNGSNERILIEDCTFGFCHSCLTCGSESIHNRNIILRRIRVDEATRLLWLKMRPDTPQNYEWITVEDITGNIGSFLYIRPWTQFFDLQGREDMPISYGANITMRRCEIDCKTFFNVRRADDQYLLKNFTFEDLKIRAEVKECDKSQIENFVWKNVSVE
ncbi:MAG: glycosyl hydrolase family 28 protein [Rikenellaceae bacterium]|nr:glycosyl hydrolase family 28 protein [Rikenellaceae bacterium]